MVDKGRALGFWGLTSDEEVLLLHVEVELVAWCRRHLSSARCVLNLASWTYSIGVTSVVETVGGAGAEMFSGVATAVKTQPCPARGWVRRGIKATACCSSRRGWASTQHREGEGQGWQPVSKEKQGGFGVQGSPEQREMGDIVEVVRLRAIAVSFSCTLVARREVQHRMRIDVAARRRGGRCDGQ
jgi:hypothetical protein